MGDFLDQNEKLAAIASLRSASNVPWRSITPNRECDWINLRNPVFGKFVAMGDRSKKGLYLFDKYSLGVNSARDSWVYNFDRRQLVENVERMLRNYNEQVRRYSEEVPKPVNASTLIDHDSQNIKWSDGLMELLRRHEVLKLDESCIRLSAYRPFTKEYCYFSKHLNERRYQLADLYHEEFQHNRSIVVSGLGGTKPFSTILVDEIPNLNLLHSSSQCFPMYRFGARVGPPGDQWFTPAVKSTHALPNVGRSVVETFRMVYSDPSIDWQDIFYYTYAVLTSPEYCLRFAADLKKVLPRIPFTEDFWAFSIAGRELGDLHVGYESVEPWPVLEITPEMPFRHSGEQLDERELYHVEEMHFAKNDKQEDRSKIIYNQYITLRDIPLDAYDYVVNGKSAIEWIMERYAWTQDKESKIVNDPNDWSADPRYIIDLLKRIIRVSIETNRIVANLPLLNEREVDLSRIRLSWSEY